MKFYFGTDLLDIRNWAADYGGLKELKSVLEDQFDHTLLVAMDDPELETFKLLQEKKKHKIIQSYIENYKKALEEDEGHILEKIVYLEA